MTTRWIPALALAALVGCGDDKVEKGEPEGGATESDTGADGWLRAPDACEAPDPLPDDPLVLVHEGTTTGLVHMLEAVYSPDRDRYYVVGIPGLTEWSDGPAGLTETARLAESIGNLEHITLVDSSYVAVSRRGDASRSGLIGLVQVTAGLTLMRRARLEDAVGLAARDGRLYVVSGQGTLSTYDISDPEDPAHLELLHTLEGLASPRDLVLDGDHAYVADNTLGLVVVDLTDPDAPVLIGPVEGSEGLQDVDAADGHVFGAAGSSGVQIFSAADPAQPELVAEITPGGAIISLSAGNGLLWTANYDGVAAIDISDPAAPVLVGTESTRSWAMGAQATEAGLFLADWNRVKTFVADPAVQAPDTHLDLSALYFPEGTTEQILTLTNTGSAAMTIAGLQADIEYIEVRVDRLVVEVGGKAQIQVQWLGQGDLSGSLCIATDDPDDPIQTLDILTSNDDSSVLIGEPAPDFALPDLDGVYRALSEQIGHPVVLVYFATW